MSRLLNTVTPNELAEKCGLRIMDGAAPGADMEATPAAWGIADAIRCAVRRRSVITRRELRIAIVPILEAAGFTSDAWSHVRQVADEMVEIGELVDVRVDHQRGYASRPSRWVRIGDRFAAIIGVAATDQIHLKPRHHLQQTRRFDTQDHAAVTSLAEQAVVEEAFGAWHGGPSWCNWLTADPMPQTLASLWSWQVSEVESRGADFAPDDTAIQAVAPTPGSFFQWPPKATSGRWTSPASLPDGAYLGAQPGHNERHWLPLLIVLANKTGRSLLLDGGPDQYSHWELFRCLLIARGTEYPDREQIFFDRNRLSAQATFPVPAQLQRCLKLCGEYLGKWKYHFADIEDSVRTLESVFSVVDWIERDLP